MKSIRTLLLTLSLLSLLRLSLPGIVQAQAGSAYDLISEVNALRTSKGLEAYSIDSGLMASAQAQSDYMASLGTWTHSRPDGSTAASRGIQENVAMGMDMSTAYCVYTIWADAVHWNTMMGFSAGAVGAGATISGGTVYYTLNVIPSGQALPAQAEVAAKIDASALLNQLAQETAVYTSNIITSTPQSDGAIYHVVTEGENLWSIAIAYGTTGAEIMTLTGNSPLTTDIYVGQVLTIRLANPATATIAATATPTRITPRPTQVFATITPSPTRTPSPSPTPTVVPPLYMRVFADSQKIGYSLAGLSLAGIVAVVVFGFLKKKP